jgi:hypothetical protein
MLSGCLDAGMHNVLGALFDLDASPRRKTRICDANAAAVVSRLDFASLALSSYACTISLSAISASRSLFYLLFFFCFLLSRNRRNRRNRPFRKSCRMPTFALSAFALSLEDTPLSVFFVWSCMLESEQHPWSRTLSGESWTCFFFFLLLPSSSSSSCCLPFCAVSVSHHTLQHLSLSCSLRCLFSKIPVLVLVLVLLWPLSSPWPTRFSF